MVGQYDTICSGIWRYKIIAGSKNDYYHYVWAYPAGQLSGISTATSSEKDFHHVGKRVGLAMVKADTESLQMYDSCCV